jgi:hypothetical protein
MAVLVCSGLPAAAAELCTASAYGDGQGNIVVLGAPAAAPATGQRYLMLDGRRGATGDANAPVSCSGDVVSFRTPAGPRSAGSDCRPAIPMQRSSVREPSWSGS